MPSRSRCPVQTVASGSSPARSLAKLPFHSLNSGRGIAEASARDQHAPGTCRGFPPATGSPGVPRSRGTDQAMIRSPVGPTSTSPSSKFGLKRTFPSWNRSTTGCCRLPWFAKCSRSCRSIVARRRRQPMRSAAWWSEPPQVERLWLRSRPGSSVRRWFSGERYPKFSGTWHRTNTSKGFHRPRPWLISRRS